jgi:hypothetical protein
MDDLEGILEPRVVVWGDIFLSRIILFKNSNTNFLSKSDQIAFSLVNDPLSRGFCSNISGASHYGDVHINEIKNTKLWHDILELVLGQPSN